MKIEKFLKFCFFDTESTERKIYNLGDSSFRTISSLIEKEREELQFDYFHFGGNGCLPLLYEKVADISCPENDISEVSKFIESINNSIVIYGGRIPLYLSEEGFFNGIEREDTNIQTLVNVEYEVRKVLEYLIKNNNQIILIYPIPTQGWNVPNLFFYEKFNWGDTVGYSYDLWRERSKNSKDLLDSIQSDQNKKSLSRKHFLPKFLIIYALVHTEIKYFIQTMITFQKMEQS